MEPLLEMQGISKAFSGVQVLHSVDFTVYKGEVVSLIGGNGAGKSTLMKIMTGVYNADEGSLTMEGAPVHIARPTDASRHGIGMIFQEFSLVPSLTVAQNIYLTRELRTKTGGLDNKRMSRQARTLLQELKVDINPDERVENLSVGYAQMVEIAKAMSQDVKLLIMDEPTASLTERETEQLFALIKRMVAGGVSIVYISHRMNEIFQVCDRITVMRDGRMVYEGSTADTSMETAVTQVVGQDMDKKYEWVPRRYDTEGTPALEVKNLRWGRRVRDVSFWLHQGEILGIAGLMGSGRSETLDALFGIARPEGGEIHAFGKPLRAKRPKDAIAAGIGYVPESRRVQGLVLMHSVKENMILPLLDKLRKGPAISERAANRTAQEEVAQLNIKTDSIHKTVELLSGGNQQKVVFAKWLANHSRILLLDEPTLGVDIGAKTEIIHIIRKLANQGDSILVVSSELTELLAMCDRVVVFHDGKVIRSIPRGDITSEGELQHAIQGF